MDTKHYDHQTIELSPRQAAKRSLMDRRRAKIVVYVTHEHKRWLEDHPEVDLSTVLQQAIANQIMKASRKAADQPKRK